jgi:hypothetical protein
VGLVALNHNLRLSLSAAFGEEVTVTPWTSYIPPLLKTELESASSDSPWMHEGRFVDYARSQLLNRILSQVSFLLADSGDCH